MTACSCTNATKIPIPFDAMSCRSLICGPQATVVAVLSPSSCVFTGGFKSSGGRPTRSDYTPRHARGLGRRTVGGTDAAKATAHKSLLRLSSCNRDCGRRDGLTLHQPEVVHASDWRGLGRPGNYGEGRDVKALRTAGCTSHTSAGFHIDAADGRQLV